jgi:hypothetical protein
MDSLIKKGHSRDYSDLISIAIQNLAVLEQGMGPSGSVVLAEPQKQASKSGPSTGIKPSTQKIQPIPATGEVHIPEMFSLAELGSLPVSTIEPPNGNLPTDGIFTLDRWLFGQYNKLLPLKANCRALARLSANHENGVPLESDAVRIAEAAALLGDYLSEFDRRDRTSRDEALATAFPRRLPDPEKAENSRARYANQFVGAVNSKGELSGLLWEYRMAVLTCAMGVSPMTARLSLTTSGLAFARLPNPILDEAQSGASGKFSTEEVDFLLDHIRRHVPAEEFAFRTLIAAIQNGADTPEKLDEALRPLVPTETNRSLSESFLSSQRSGALSRMADLALIARVRKGVRVSYVVTEQEAGFVSGGERQ